MIRLRKHFLKETRRGDIVMAVLAALQKERYGEQLRKAMKEKGMSVGAFTLYPLLRRLERQELLENEWRVENDRPKRFYRLSPHGSRFLAAMLPAWRANNACVEAFCAEGKHAPIGQGRPEQSHVIAPRRGASKGTEHASA